MADQHIVAIERHGTIDGVDAYVWRCCCGVILDPQWACASLAWVETDAETHKRHASAKGDQVSMTRPLNPARTITAPYSADHPPPMPERIRALLGKPAADLSRAELLDIAADAANRDPWDLCGDRKHVGAICDLACTLEAEISVMERAVEITIERSASALDAERKAHAATRAQLEALLASGATLPEPPDQHPSGALETLLTTGPDEPGPHDAITVDSALDDDDETRVATDEELRR